MLRQHVILLGYSFNFFLNATCLCLSHSQVTLKSSVNLHKCWKISNETRFDLLQLKFSRTTSSRGLKISTSPGPRMQMHAFKTHKQRQKQQSGANRLTHPYKYILTPPVTMCSQQLCVLH